MCLKQGLALYLQFLRADPGTAQPRVCLGSLSGFQLPDMDSVAQQIWNVQEKEMAPAEQTFPF